MSDFERRVAAALGTASADAPEAHGLAEAARDRAGRRRRTALAVAGALVTVVVVTPLAWNLLGGTDDADRGVDPATGTDPVPPGWRAESWRDLELHVPDAWGQGNLSSYCAGDAGLDRPLVERPEGVWPAIACTPATAFGARFYDPEIAGVPVDAPEGSLVQMRSPDDYPDGAWVGWTEVGHAGVLVVGPSEAVARQVLGSATQIQVQDSRGCPPGVYANTDFSGPDHTTGPITVCRYAGTGPGVEPGYWLAESSALSAEESDSVRSTIQASPEGQGEFLRCEAESEFYLLVADGGVAAWVYNGACGEHWVMTLAPDGSDVVFHQPNDLLLRLIGSPWGDLRP
jgi:hypothetical protein